MLQDKIFTCFGKWYQSWNLNQPLQAVKIGEDLHPVAPKDKEVFIYGEGWKKIGAKKRIDLPQLSDETDVQAYLDTYGKYCLFKALTARELNTNDCCYTSLQNEFTAMIALGVNKWMEYVQRVRKLRETVNSIYTEKYGIIADNEIMQRTKNGVNLFRDNIFTVTVNHYIVYPFRSRPHFDPIADDTRLFNTYYRCELNAKPEYDPEMNDGIFPESVKDRLTYLFNEDVSKEYADLMHFFGL